MLRKALLVVAGVGVALLLIEGVLRAARITHPIFFQRDPLVGVWHRPGASGWHTREGVAWVQINSAGMRDREHELAKPEGVYRIAVLGDSYAEALQVPLEETFWSVMERRLDGCRALGGRTPEALNFGVSGFGTAQELLTLRNFAWQYDPDLVLLAFVGNDLRNNSPALEHNAAAPYFVYRKGQLVLDGSFVHTDFVRRRNHWLLLLRNRLADHSYVLQLLNEVRMLRRRSARAAIELPVQQYVFGPPASPEWEESWRVTEALLGKLALETRERGVPFLLVKVTNHIQVDPDPARREALVEQGMDPSYVDRRLLSLAEREGFPALSLAETLRAYAEANQVCVHGFENAEPCGGHWNAEGHRVAGEQIADWLCGLAGRGFRPQAG